MPPIEVPSFPELKRATSTSGSNSSKDKTSALAQTFSLNAGVDDVLLCIRQELRDMTQTMGDLKMFVHMNLPSIEQLDNVGTMPQVEALALLTGTEAAGYNMLDRFSNYHTSRG